MLEDIVEPLCGPIRGNWPSPSFETSEAPGFSSFSARESSEEAAGLLAYSAAVCLSNFLEKIKVIYSTLSL